MLDGHKQIHFPYCYGEDSIVVYCAEATHLHQRVFSEQFTFSFPKWNP